MPVGYGGKNDAPTPRSSAASGASRSVSSSTSRASGMGGGLGLTTGKTMYGNTAFGTAGGMAKGYATASGLGSGMGPSQKTYSGFKGLDGSAMFSGRAAQPIKAGSATQALGIAQQLASMYQARPRIPAATQPVSGAVRPKQPTLMGSVPPKQKPQSMGLIHAILGGGGMLGYGMNPANGGSWDEAGKRWYGGYEKPKGYEGYNTSVQPYNPKGGYPGLSFQSKDIPGMPAPTGEAFVKW